ncbi:MAG TPA: DUF695 domain-containing protein [Steroidobacteraceae bacterium]|nr:DUF695 domain-containing protein [Steroidobacteraceae bacterium]
MTEDWRYFPCTMGESTAFIFVDVGITETIDRAPANLVKIRLAYKNPHPNGLPSDEEFYAVGSIERALETFVTETSGWYIGRVTVDGHRHFYVYSAKEEAHWSSFLDSLSATTGYQLEADTRSDPQHEGYWQDLYPTDDDWQVINDLAVIDAIDRNGDNGTEPRQIDHWVYFGNQTGMLPFLTWARSEGFTHDEANSSSTDDGRYCLRLSHHGPAEITEISHRTIALRRKALEYGGEYDGWETPVVSSKSS